VVPAVVGEVRVAEDDIAPRPVGQVHLEAADGGADVEEFEADGVVTDDDSGFCRGHSVTLAALWGGQRERPRRV
jgi:hypothetical protein